MEENSEKRNEFLDYIKSFYKNYVNFKGTVSKREFWITYLIMFIGFPLCLVILIALITYMIFKWDTATNSLIGLILYLLGSIIPMVSITIRRVNDTGRDGLLGLIPLGIFILGFITPYFVNPWNHDEDEATLTLMIIFTLLSIITLVVLCSPDSNSHMKIHNKVDNVTVGVEINKFDELLKLKDFLDNGILTQDEFDEQKKKILNK